MASLSHTPLASHSAQHYVVLSSTLKAHVWIPKPVSVLMPDYNHFDNPEQQVCLQSAVVYLAQSHPIWSRFRVGTLVSAELRLRILRLLLLRVELLVQRLRTVLLLLAYQQMEAEEMILGSRDTQNGSS